MIKNRFLACIFLVLSLAIFSQSTSIPSSLRGGIAADAKTIKIALAMQKDGWKYVMPEPKSPQAAWGNTDGRTTWWEGYWENTITGAFSSETPKLKDGKYIGDGVDDRGWRRGGSPGRPTVLEWLLSESGGIMPRG